jgi:hypothetical protein
MDEEGRKTAALVAACAPDTNALNVRSLPWRGSVRAYGGT